MMSIYNLFTDKDKMKIKISYKMAHLDKPSWQDIIDTSSKIEGLLPSEAIKACETEDWFRQYCETHGIPEDIISACEKDCKKLDEQKYEETKECVASTKQEMEKFIGNDPILPVIADFNQNIIPDIENKDGTNSLEYRTAITQLALLQVANRNNNINETENINLA